MQVKRPYLLKTIQYKNNLYTKINFGPKLVRQNTLDPLKFGRIVYLNEC